MNVIVDELMKKGTNIYCKNSQARIYKVLIIQKKLKYLKNEHFIYNREDYTYVFIEKIEKILQNFANFAEQKMIFTEEDLTNIGQRKLIT